MSVDGSPVPFLGVAELDITVQEVKIQQEVIVVESLTAMGILGLDFLECNHGNIDTSKRTLYLPNSQVEIPLKRHCRKSPPQHSDSQITVAVQHTVVIPPLSELEVMATVSESDLSDDQWLVESLNTRGAVVVARAIVSPVSGCCPVRLLNPRSEIITLTSGSKVAELQDQQISNHCLSPTV